MLPAVQLGKPSGYIPYQGQEEGVRAQASSLLDWGLLQETVTSEKKLQAITGQPAVCSSGQWGRVGPAAERGELNMGRGKAWKENSAPPEHPKGPHGRL